MTTITPVTEQDFLRFCEKNHICRELGCPNECARGYVVCETCLHGPPDRANEKLILAKRAVERRLAKKEDRA